jgi:hypothetical protein
MCRCSYDFTSCRNCASKMTKGWLDTRTIGNDGLLVEKVLEIFNDDTKTWYISRHTHFQYPLPPFPQILIHRVPQSWTWWQRKPWSFTHVTVTFDVVQKEFKIAWIWMPWKGQWLCSSFRLPTIGQPIVYICVGRESRLPHFTVISKLGSVLWFLFFISFQT